MCCLREASKNLCHTCSLVGLVLVANCWVFHRVIAELPWFALNCNGFAEDCHVNASLYSGSSVPRLSLSCAVDLFVRGKYLQWWIEYLAGNFLSSVERAVWFFLVVYGKVRKQTNRKWIVKQKGSQIKELENSQPCPYLGGHIIYRKEYQGGDWTFPYFLMDSRGSGCSLACYKEENDLGICPLIIMHGLNFC